MGTKVKGNVSLLGTHTAGTSPMIVYWGVEGPRRDIHA